MVLNVLNATRVTVFFGGGETNSWSPCQVTAHANVPAWVIWQDGVEKAIVPVAATIIEIDRAVGE